MKTELNRNVRPLFYAAMIGLAGFAASAGIGLVRGIPVPIANDEFCYMLAADTFAHGRLTNLPHPLWVHFETSHTIQQPTYMAKYPPGQGLALALGQVTGGKPIWGVWLSFGLMCAAIYWMSHAWLPQSYALAGGMFAIFNPILGASGYWAQSYWGGAVAATGGALALGAARKLVNAPCQRDALILAIGFAVLANSRPYEGLVFSAAVMATLAWRRVSLRRLLAPVTLVMLITAGWMAFYNFRVTGNPLRMPFQVYSEQYDIAPKFIFEPLRPEPEFRHGILRNRAYDTELSMYETVRTAVGFVLKNFLYLGLWLWSSLNLFLLPLMFVLPALARWLKTDADGRMLLLIVVVFSLGIALEVGMMVHYLAPALGLSYLLGLRAVQLWRWHYTAAAVSSLAVLGFALALYLNAGGGTDTMQRHRRAAIQQELEATGERHLILVRYGLNHPPVNEWVHNGADIDAAKIVWARDPDHGDSCELIRYFKDRRIWRLDADHLPGARLISLSPADACVLDATAEG